MKERILTGWTFQRGLFVVIGLIIMIQSFVEKEWLSTLLGGYFFSMGLFSFGCASGSCFSGNCGVDSRTNKKEITDIEFEEVKN
jgi:hypothetical protein